MSEKILNYPPQSAYFIDPNDQRVNVIDSFNAATRVVLAGGAPADAFGRQRIVEPRTLGDYKIVYEQGSDYNTSITGTGDIVFDYNKSCVILSTGAEGGTAINQTKMYHNYAPGKSQLILTSFVLGNAEEGCTKRLGYFDEKNGLFLEQNEDGDLFFVIRSDTTETPVDRKFAQSDWNGEDVSWLNQSETQLMFIDFQWLGVGRVRFGFVHEDNFIVAHTVYNSNNLDVVYMRTANLPIRYEISGGVSAQLTQICATVISEGGYAEVGRDYANGNLSAVSINTNSKIIFAIKLNDTVNGFDNRAYVRYTSANVLSTGNTTRYDIIKLSSEDDIIGGTWTAEGSSSVVSYNSTATGAVLTNAEYIAGGLVASGGVGVNVRAGVDSTDNSTGSRKNFIAQNYGSTDSEVFAIIARTFSGTSSVLSLMEWREIY